MYLTYYTRHHPDKPIPFHLLLLDSWIEFIQNISDKLLIKTSSTDNKKTSSNNQIQFNYKQLFDPPVEELNYHPSAMNKSKKNSVFSYYNLTEMSNSELNIGDPACSFHFRPTTKDCFNSIKQWKKMAKIKQI